MRHHLALLCALALCVALLAAPASAVSIDWVTVGDPGNACDTQSTGCFGARGVHLPDLEVRGHERAVRGVPEREGRLGSTRRSTTRDMGAGFGGITRSGTSGSYTYGAIAGRDDMPVNFVSFYDALRFANWLNNGQGSGDTETGAYTLLGRDRDAEQRHDGDAQRRRQHLPHERGRVVQGGVLRRSVDELLRLPGGDEHADGLRGAGGDGQHGELRPGGRRPDRRGRATRARRARTAPSTRVGTSAEWNEAIVSGSIRGSGAGTSTATWQDLAASNQFDASAELESSVFGFRVASPKPGGAGDLHARAVRVSRRRRRLPSRYTSPREAALLPHPPPHPRRRGPLARPRQGRPPRGHPRDRLHLRRGPLARHGLPPRVGAGGRSQRRLCARGGGDGGGRTRRGRGAAHAVRCRAARAFSRDGDDDRGRDRTRSREARGASRRARGTRPEAAREARAGAERSPIVGRE